MCRLASAPNPVETPYTGSGLAASASTISRAAASASTAAAESSTRALPRATAMTS